MNKNDIEDDEMKYGWSDVNPSKKPVKASQDDGYDYDVNELLLYITNDGQLYRGQTTSIIKNLARKMASGKYDDELAVKAWQYLADSGVKKYDKEFGSRGGSVAWFPKKDRIVLAKALRDYYKEQIEQEVNDMKTKKSGTSVKSCKVVWKKTGNSTGRKLGCLDDFHPRYGASECWKNIKKFNKIDALEQLIDDEYYDESAGEGVITEDELNTLLWYETEWVYKALGLYYDVETEQVSDKPIKLKYFWEDEDYDDAAVEEDEVYSGTSVKSCKHAGNKSIKAARIYSDGLGDFHPWSGAIDCWDNLEKFDKIDTLEQVIEYLFYDESVGEGVISKDELNDWLWFEPEQVYKAVGLYYNEDNGEVSDEPFDDDEDDEDDEYNVNESYRPKRKFTVKSSRNYRNHK